MLIVRVVASLLVMAVLALAGPLLEDLVEWFRKMSHGRGKPVPPGRAERVPRHSVHR